MRKNFLIIVLLSIAPCLSYAQLSDKAVTTIEKAMRDELDRSKSQLHLSGLIDPFYISYSAADNQRIDVAASFGAITRSSETHTRALNLRLLINNYQFNDENFTDGSSIFGGGPSIDMNLPLDEDYNNVRRAFWLATDNLFKDANETFTKKKAALERKQLPEEDRNLADFSQAPGIEIIQPPIPYSANKTKQEELVKQLSAIFLKYKQIQNCTASLSYVNAYRLQISTENSHTRTPYTECTLTVQATAQAQDDGEPLSLAFTISEASPNDLPPISELTSRTEKLATDLVALAQASKYNDKEYSGPVLFEASAASDFISEQIVAKFSAKRDDPLGGGDIFFSGGAKGGNFQKKLETRILPASVNVIDNPMSQDKTLGHPLMGAYAVDEEGVAPKRLQLVKDGILKTLYMSRTPTKEVKEPNGHSRPTIGGGGMAVGAGIVTFTDAKAKPTADLKKELLKIAKEDGYDYALVVRSTQQGMLNFSEGLSSVSDLVEGSKAMQPALVYKVYANGKEELVRGLEINFPTTRDLKELQFSKESATRNIQMAAGAGAGLFGFANKVPATLIGPTTILVPELEARKKQASAYPIKPIVERP